MIVNDPSIRAQRPVAQQAPEQHQLPDMVGGVIRHQQQLAEIRLTRTVRDPRREIDAGVRSQLLELLPILAETGGCCRPTHRRREAQATPASSRAATPSPDNPAFTQKSRMSCCVMRKCSISCQAEYGAPLGVVARCGDREVLHRAVEPGVRVFPGKQALEVSAKRGIDRSCRSRVRIVPGPTRLSAFPCSSPSTDRASASPGSGCGRTPDRARRNSSR